MRYKEIIFPEDNDYLDTPNGIYLIDDFDNEYAISPSDTGIKILMDGGDVFIEKYEAPKNKIKRKKNNK